MLSELTHHDFSDPDGIFEGKLDGERALTSSRERGEVELKSRDQGSLWFPRYAGLRRDKEPRNVHQEPQSRAADNSRHRRSGLVRN
jgi:hypothetical protein